MRRRRPLAFVGFLVVVAAAVIGFASFTTDRRPVAPAPSSAAVDAAEVTVEVVSGRLTAAILSSRLTTTSASDLETAGGGDTTGAAEVADTPDEPSPPSGGSESKTARRAP